MPRTKPTTVLFRPPPYATSRRPKGELSENDPEPTEMAHDEGFQTKSERRANRKATATRINFGTVTLGQGVGEGRGGVTLKSHWLQLTHAQRKGGGKVEAS